MKKFLSLVLALAMTLSLVTISAGAKDFADSDELSGEQYEEAVNVMSEMEIIDGYADGDFRPQGTLTRGAAAKIIACMMLGKTTAEALGTQAAPFKDVPVGSTFAGYIAYCVEAGLIDGYADGTFRPSGTLTGFAFLKMLLTALGYDSSIEGYTGTNWTVNVASRATQIGLTDGNDEFVGTRAATREEACLYAVNTLKATLVEYENKGQEITVSDGTVINVRPSAPTYVTSNIAGAATSIDDTYDNTRQDYTVEFAEKYQPDLELDGTTDVFGRPAHIWTWKNDEIGTYVDYDKLVAEYTTKVTGRDLYEALGKSALDACKDRVYIYVDGETDGDILGNAYFTENQITRSYTDTVGETGNGVLTQVFHDTRADEITIAVINTYLAKADEDYDDKNDDVDLTVYEIQKDGRVYMKTEDQKETMSVEGEDFAIEDVTEDQLFLVTVADGEIQTMADPEILSETTLVNFRLGKYVTADTQYDYADTAMYDEEVLDMYDDANMKDVTYNVILDQYGYMIGIELNQEPDQYLFLTGIDLGSSNLSKRNADANVIFMSGEMDTITVDMRDSVMTWVADTDGDGKYDVETDDLSKLTTALKADSDKETRAQLNTWCTYTVDANGVYTLEQVADRTIAKDYAEDKAVKVAQSDDDAVSGTMTIDQRNVSLSGYGISRVYGNDDTVYLTVDPADDMENIVDRNGNNVTIIDDVSSVVTGVKNVKLTVKDLTAATAPVNEVYTLYNSDGYVIAAVVLGEDEGITTNYAYVTSSDVNREAYSSNEWTWTREVVINGKLVELAEVGTSLRYLDDMDQGDWYEVKYDANGNVRSAKEIDFTADGALDGDAGIGNNLNRNEDEFAIDVEELNEPANATENLMEAYDTVVLSDETTVEKLTFKNGTLYTNRLATEGFAVSANVNVVLVLASKIDRNGNYDTFDDVDDSYTGYSGLEKAIRDLNADNGNGFAAGNVEVQAVIENGAATSIIINDKTPAGTLVGPVVPGNIAVTFNGNNAYVSWTGNAPTVNNMVNAIQAQIKAMGWDEVYVTSGYDVHGNLEYYFQPYRMINGVAVPGSRYTFNTVTGQTMTVSVNGTATQVNPTDTLKNLVDDALLTGFITVNGKYVAAADYNATDLKQNDVIVSGLSAIKGENGIVYGKPGTAIGGDAAKALNGTIVASAYDDGSAKDVEDVQFPAAGKTDNYTAGVAGKTDDWFKLTRDGNVVYVKNGSTVINVGSSYVLINGALYSNTDALAYKITADTVMETEYYELTVTDATPAVIASSSWSDNVVEDGGKYFAKANTDVTLTITTGTIAPTGTSDDVLTIKGTGASLVGAKFDTSDMSTPIDTTATPGAITFAQGQTWQSGTITVKLAVTSAQTTITLDWD